MKNVGAKGPYIQIRHTITSLILYQGSKTNNYKRSMSIKFTITNYQHPSSITTF